MDKVDWDCELGEASDGNKLFPSQAALEAHKKCVTTCGVVEVEVRLRRVIRESDHSIKPDKTYSVVKYNKSGKRTEKKMLGKDLLKQIKQKKKKPSAS